MPPAQPIVVITADSRFDELHTLSCSGTDITPNKALVSSIKLSSRFECALLSANFEGLKRGDVKDFSVHFKNISCQGPLYRHSGAFDANKDNVVDCKSAPLYRSLTMANDEEHAQIELEIRGPDGAPITGNAGWGNSYFTIRFRHKKDYLMNEFIKEVKQANQNTNTTASAITQACYLIQAAVQEQKQSQDLTKIAVNQVKESVNLTKASCDSIVLSTALVRTAVDQARAGIEGAVTSCEGAVASMSADLSGNLKECTAACETIEIATQGVFNAVNQNKAATEAGHASLNVNLALIKTSCDDVHDACDEVKASAIENKDALNISLGQVKSACDSVKTSTDNVGSLVNAAKTGISAAVSACQIGITGAVQAHQTSTDAMSQKIRYKLLF
tara:strand:+ start:936 stop:2099 length:1164 start_codon:yes stop_codon:yes gene_type:complete